MDWEDLKPERYYRLEIEPFSSPAQQYDSAQYIGSMFWSIENDPSTDAPMHMFWPSEGGPWIVVRQQDILEATEILPA